MLLPILLFVAQTSQPPTPSRGDLSQQQQAQSNRQSGNPDVQSERGVSVTVTNAPQIQLAAPQEDAKTDKGSKEAIDLGMLITNIILAVATLIVAGLTWRQSIHTQRAFDLTSSARLVVRGIVIRDLERLLSPDVRDLVVSLNGQIHLANIGHTDATIKRIESGFSIGDQPLGMDPLGEAIIQEVTLRIPSGETHPLMAVNASLTVEQANEVRLGRAEVYILGRIYFLDSVGRKREMAFCRRLDRRLRAFVVAPEFGLEYND